MRKLNIYIVEDEPLVADDISITLEEEGYQIAGIADNYEDAVNDISATRPDLVLLDITIRGKKTGIDIAEKLNDLSIPFVFLSAHSDSATLKNAMKLFPSGYLVKPLHKNDLKTTISLAIFKSHAGEKKSPVVNDITFNDSFFIREKGNIIKLIPTDIIYVEALDNYCQVFAFQKRYVLSSTLKTLEEKLIPFGFVRIHRSYLVQWKMITSISENTVQLDSLQIPLGKTFRQDLLRKLNML